MSSNITLKNQQQTEFKIQHNDGDGAITVSSKDIASTKTINSIAELRLLDGSVYGRVEVLGYYTAGDGGGGDFYWDSVSVEADNGGTIFVATGITTGRWKRLYSGNVNVKLFGAKGDGVTDDTVAIQSTINSNKSIEFDNGVYTVTYLTILNKSVNIYGSAGTILKFKAESLVNGSSGIIRFDGCSDCIIKDVIIDGNKSNQTLDTSTTDRGAGVGIIVYNSTNITVDNCTLQNITMGAAILVSNLYNTVAPYITDASYGIKILNNTIKDCGGTSLQPSDGIYISSAGCLVQGNTIDNVNDYGIATDYTSFGIFKGNVVRNALVLQGVLGNHYCQYIGNNYENGQIGINITTSGNTTGIIYDSDNVLIANNVVKNISSATLQAEGINATAGHDFTIIGNYVDTAKQGIIVGSAPNCVVSNNTIKNIVDKYIQSTAYNIVQGNYTDGSNNYIYGEHIGVQIPYKKEIFLKKTCTYNVYQRFAYISSTNSSAAIAKIYITGYLTGIDAHVAIEMALSLSWNAAGVLTLAGLYEYGNDTNVILAIGNNGNRGEILVRIDNASATASELALYCELYNQNTSNSNNVYFEIA